MGKGQRERRRRAAAQNAGPTSSSISAADPSARPSPSSSLSRPAGEPSSATVQPNRRAVGVASQGWSNSTTENNYVRIIANLRQNFILFLKDLHDKDKLEVLLSMRDRVTYIIKVSYNQLCEFNDLDLMVNVCQWQHRLENWLLPAAQQFLISCSDLEYDERRHKTRLSLVNFPASVKKLQDFLSSDDLFESVKIFGGNLSVLAATVHGRCLIAMLIVGLLESHSKSISWDGTFTIADIVVIDDRRDFKQMKIVKTPMEANICVGRMQEAKVKDLQRVAELINEHYKMDDGTLPVYFRQLREDLGGATNQLVEEEWYRNYLSYHVAFMPSTARRYLETMLYATYKNCTPCYIPFLLAKPFVYLQNDWRVSLNKLPKDYITKALLSVYSYQSPSHHLETDRYEDSVRGLMKFKRNFLEHGGQGQACFRITELELCTAKIFDEFLPSLVRTLLEEGHMERVFGEAWKRFKASRLEQSNL